MTAAYDPTYFFPAVGWTAQSNHQSSGGTGPGGNGTVSGEIGWINTTVGNITINGVLQSAVGGASGPLSSTSADPSLSGAVSIDWEKRYNTGNVPPGPGTVQGLYKPLNAPATSITSKAKLKSGKVSNG